MPEHHSYIAVNNTDAGGTAHIVGGDAHGAAEQWWQAVERLSGDDEEPFGFRAEVGTAHRVLDPIEALNLIDRACYFLRPNTRDAVPQGEEPVDRLPAVTYTDGEPDVHMLVTLPVFPTALDVHTDTILQLLRLAGTAGFAFAPNIAPGMKALPRDCVHLSISYADRRHPRTLTLCVGDPEDSETLTAAGNFARLSMSEHLVFLPQGADFLRETLRA